MVVTRGEDKNNTKNKRPKSGSKPDFGLLKQFVYVERCMHGLGESETKTDHRNMIRRRRSYPIRTMRSKLCCAGLLLYH